MGWAPDYIDVEAAAKFLKIDDDYDHDELLDFIGAASAAINRHTHRQFGLVDAAEERFYRARPDYERGLWVVDIDDVMTTAGAAVEVDGTTITTANYTLEPRNAAAKGRPWTRLVLGSSAEATPTGIEYDVAVTLRWGWSAFPRAIVAACKLQTSRFHARRDSPFGVAGSPDTGGELRLLAKVDPDVGVSLTDYVRTARPQ